MKKIRMIIAGGRDFKNYEYLAKSVKEVIQEENLGSYNINDIEEVCGCARGADMLGRDFAMRNGIIVKNFPADWDQYGKSAGFIRNKQMGEYANEAEIGILVAFWDGKSAGTKNMIDIAVNLGLRVHIKRY